jgi:predicted adenine nucleotide alpha hydrolase (AANH) superfamily ATPase
MVETFGMSVSGEGGGRCAFCYRMEYADDAGAAAHLSQTLSDPI